MHVLIPVKRLDHAKSRLQRVLGAHERRTLASCLLDDTLATCIDVPWIERVVVVTSNDHVAQRAADHRAVVVREPPTVRDPQQPHGPLNAALEAGRRWALEDGAQTLASLPVDLPLLPAIDMHRLRVVVAEGQVVESEGSSNEAVVLLQTDSESDGTNLLVQTPVGAIPFRYGAASFRRHRDEARRAGARVIEVQDPALVWDLDHPDDPRRWAQVLRHDERRRRLYARARERGTALRFLEETAWGAPLREQLRSV